MDIYLGRLEEAMTKCDYRIFGGNVPPGAIYISNATFAISTTAQELRLICDVDERIVRDPRFMVINLPCNCNMAFENVFVPKATSNCHEQDVVNLAHLVSFAQIHVVNSIIDVKLPMDPITEDTIVLPSTNDIIAKMINKAKAADASEGLNLMRTAHAVSLIPPPPPPSDMWTKLFLDLPWQGILSCALTGAWALAISICVGYFGYRLYVINLAMVAMAPHGVIPSASADQSTPMPTTPPALGDDYELLAVAVLSCCAAFLLYMFLRVLVAIKAYRNIKIRQCLNCKSRLAIVITGDTHVAKFDVCTLRFAKGYMHNINVPSLTVSRISGCCGLFASVSLAWKGNLKFNYLAREYDLKLPDGFMVYGHRAGQLANMAQLRDSNDVSVSAVVDKICNCKMPLPSAHDNEV